MNARNVERPYVLESHGQLAQLRVTKGLKQADAAAQLGLAPKSLSNIERGTVKASDQVLEAMVTLYGVTSEMVRAAHRADRQAFIVRDMG